MTAPSVTRGIEEVTSGTRARHISAISFWLLSLALFWSQFCALATLSLHDEYSSHILLIPLISASVVYLQRKRIFHAPRYAPRIGLPLLLAAAALWFGLQPILSFLSQTDQLSVLASLIVLVWIAAFVLFYGPDSFRRATFPLLFLLLMIPIPAIWADGAVSLLQKGSADTCEFLFHVLRVPVLRHGFQFDLPGVTIEVAEQCSGIHSGLALIITGLLAEHVFLQGPWKKIFFILCIVPIAIFKNAVRIVTIAWLGIHLNSGFFYGNLHRRGGLPFSLLALAMMTVLLWLLRPTGFQGCPPALRVGSDLV